MDWYFFQFLFWFSFLSVYFMFLLLCFGFIFWFCFRVIFCCRINFLIWSGFLYIIFRNYFVWIWGCRIEVCFCDIFVCILKIFIYIIVVCWDWGWLFWFFIMDILLNLYVDLRFIIEIKNEVRFIFRKVVV